MTMNDPILVVDDEAVLRNNLARYLRLQGYEVETAGSGEEALAALESTTFRLVLTDLRMPGMDGLALIRHLQTEHPDALTVLMTAYASVESAVEALRVDHLGNYDHLGNSWSAAMQYARHKKLKQSKVGAFELYKNDPNVVAPADLVTEIYLPLK